jgi:hypothetical protein
VSDPKPFTSHKAATVFLRVPHTDWAAIKRGSKTEFRTHGLGYPALFNVKTPTAVVAYVMRGKPPRYEHCMLVLEETFREPLGAISPESLAREGFPDIAHFRRYWMGRTKLRFRPLSEVQAYRVRPYRQGDTAMLGLVLMERLYGDYFNGKR